MKRHHLGFLAALVAVASVTAVAPARAALVPTVSIGDVSVVEGTSTNRVARFAVTLNAPSTTAVSVNFTVIGGTATAGTDYTVRNQVVRFAPDASGFTPVEKYVAVAVRPDTAGESDETVLARIANPTAGYGVGRADATATIIDDDPVATNAISLGDASIVEGDSGMRILRFPVTLSARSYTESVSISWTVDSVSAMCAGITNRQPTVPGQDCGVLTNLVRPGNLTRALFPLGPAPPRTGIPGPTAVTKTLDFAIFPDTQAEGDEQFTVTIHSTSTFPVGRAVATGTIIDDD